MRASHPLLRPCLAPLMAALLAACDREPPAEAPAPHAEFIIAAADSVYWVRSDEDGIRVRGAPMMLAQVGSRFSELYVVDEDHSFYDAMYVGQRLYKRDLISGDSVALIADSLMPMLARAYAAANPDERPLEPDEEGNENPRTIATAELMVLDVHGPWLSYEYRTDVDVIGGTAAHGARRGVLDLRTGTTATVDALFGSGPGRRIVASGRERWTRMRDSLFLAVDTTDAEARADLERLAFDPKSFTLDAEDREPRVRFAITQSGAGAADGIFVLDGLVAPEPRWWNGVRQSFPIEESIDEIVWPRDGFTLVGRDAQMGTARIAFAIRDQKGVEWRLGSVPSPVLRVMWLVDSLTAPGTRAALTRAFNEAAFYSGDVRVVQQSRRPALPSFVRPAHAAPREVVATRRHDAQRTARTVLRREVRR